ncbi:AAA family ATPase (plasmid) [Cupriavidus sp. P-10]|uniref:trifunctional serine/threonine-protein kinase/ATP-binding protein/sensor histidine kinase n=1 Tax=Cupriavidus sp. P-10 TaxID=2027911 RepID=UPI000E2FDF19|nr:AAA family ATPase [Cupriavidus sp. P-10]BDB28892.1 AAA family ATPase [Cupriavidus sp. P-10]
MFYAGAESGFDLFWEEGDRSFGRYVPRGTERSVLMVRPLAEKPCPGTLSKLAHEFELRELLDAAWAVSPVEIQRASGSAALFLADPGGEPLSRVMGTALDVGDFLDLAIAIATAVGQLHQSGLVHKDLKPGHILVAPWHTQVWLTGFGNASLVRRDVHEVVTVNDIVGTLAYMSPEQTGWMNRAIDTRSDLYSIGVTFYQMLCGELPFNASAPKDWVHYHLARQPLTPAERISGIPRVVSDLVMKLLAKSPDERYQTAAGLKADLQRCQSEWRIAESIVVFQLGQYDLSEGLSFPDRLYGREKEIAALSEAWGRVRATGRNELVLVSGYSGAGKTSVVNELRRVMVEDCSLLASGKAELREKTIPYATLAHALGGVLQRFVSMPVEQQTIWRTMLAKAVASDGALLAPLVPQLEQMLGRYPSISDLQPGEAARRLREALEALIAVLAQYSAPLTIFLDDVQWLDEETITFVQRLIADHRLPGVLVVCAYRENEVVAGHPLMVSAGVLRDDGHRVCEIELADLDVASLGQMLADTLHCSTQASAPLARLVKERTAGNPFFVIQFLTELVEDGMLGLDHGAGLWAWDLEQIRSKGFTDNVVELMLGRIGRLRSDTQKALQLLACFGNDSTLENLNRVWSDQERAVVPCLWDAIRAGLVTRRENVVQFRHDRIHEAAYALIPEADRLQLHLRIGRQLAAQVPSEEFDDNIFTIVEQFNLGAKLVRTPSERERLAELNLAAALRAKMASAYPTAHQYLGAAAENLDDETRLRRHDLAFLIAQHLAECEFHTGQLESAERRLAHLARTAAELRQLAVITQLQLELLLTVGRREEAVSVGLQYLGRAGVHWSSQPSLEVVKMEEEAMWRQIGTLPIEQLCEHRCMVEPEVLGTMRVLVALMQPAWHSNDNLRRLVIFRMVNLSLRYGNSDESAMVYGWLSMLLISKPGVTSAACAFGRVALALAERSGNERYTARVFQIVGGNVLHWSQPLHVARDVLDQALKVTEATHNFTYAAYIHSNRITHGLAQGESLASVQAAMEQGSIATWGDRYDLVRDRIAPRMQLVRMLRGETPVFGVLDSEDFDEAAFESYLQGDIGRLLATSWYWIRKMQARYLAGDYAVAAECAHKAQALMWTSPAYFEQVEYHFYAALAIAACVGSREENRAGDSLRKVAEHHRQLLSWAELCPSTFACRAALVGAEIARLEGQSLQAMHGYESAIASARDNDFVHVRAMANEIAARFYLHSGLEKASRGYLLEARHCYSYWGADAKVWQIDALYPSIANESRSVRLSGTIDTPIKHLDLSTVIAVSQTVSGEISLDRLIEMLVRTAIEQAGASRGVLLLPLQDEFRVVAEARVAGSDIAINHERRTPCSDDVPLSLICQVIQGQEHVVLDDAFLPTVAASDPYFQRRKIRSILCLPLLNQAKLVGVLYLENELAPRVFVPARTEIIKLLAFQAATALENSRLYEERKQADDALHRAQVELAHVSRVMTMSALASSIAHEVSQPLAAVVANANAAVRWLNRKVPDLNEVGEALTAIVAQGQRASDVIVGMRSMLRKTSGPRNTLDINSVIMQTLGLIDGEASRHCCTIETTLSPDLPHVTGDRVQLQQVILNLVMNGLEAMRAEDMPQRILSVQTVSSPDGVTVAVSDRGVGLDENARSRLFDAFFTTKPEGLGMGLAICLSIVESHGGQLWAEPRQPQGTVFRFSLPKARTI